MAEDHEGWMARSRVMLTPIAAPSIMGLFGFAMATVMLGAYQVWHEPGRHIRPWTLTPQAGAPAPEAPRGAGCDGAEFIR